MKAIIVPLVLFCNLCFGQKEFDADSCIFLRWADSIGGGHVILGMEKRIDTVPTILLFIETSKGNTSKGCRWVHGYEVRASNGWDVNVFYLDYRKRRLPKNVVVFMSIN